jgi:hypothetical protein
VGIGWAVLSYLNKRCYDCNYGAPNIARRIRSLITVLFIADAIRSLAGASYLIQVKELSSDKIRTSCTISLIVTFAMTFTLVFSARPIASFYANPMLERYFHVIGISYLISPFSYQLRHS